MSNQLPERCPWCGAPPLGLGIGPNRGAYQCGAGAYHGYAMWHVNKAHNTPEALEYRRTLARRKLLSQHTGVPLPLITDPIRTEPYLAWNNGIRLMPQGKRWRLECWHGDRVDLLCASVRERARRKLTRSGGAR